MGALQIVKVGKIKGYVDEGQIAYIRLEDAAFGLGIIKVDKKNGVEYKRIHAQNLKRWLVSFGLLKSEADELPEYIPEPVFYLLAMKANNEAARVFQRKIAYEILPAIRKKGFYGQVSRTDAMEMCYKHKISVEDYCEYRTGKGFADYATNRVRALQSWQDKQKDYGTYTYTIDSIAEEMGVDKNVLAGVLYDNKLNKRKDCCRWFDNCGWRFSWFGRYLLSTKLPQDISANTLY